MLCSSVSADHNGMAASRFLAAASARVILLSFLQLRVVNRIVVAA